MNGKLAPLKVKMTSRKQFNYNCMIEWTKSKFETIMTSYGPNKNLYDELINITGHVLTEFKETLLTEQKTRALFKHHVLTLL